MKPKEVIHRAYINVPKEPIPNIDFDFITFRGIKYHWLKLVRKFTRK